MNVCRRGAAGHQIVFTCHTVTFAAAPLVLFAQRETPAVFCPATYRREVNRSRPPSTKASTTLWSTKTCSSARALPPTTTGFPVRAMIGDLAPDEPLPARLKAKTFELTRPWTQHGLCPRRPRRATAALSSFKYMNHVD
ncbi:hypothetical protein DIPPA_25171 [Diplonema papillatum]|nr:hypothetical protein DIPPA_25171 [Diplonema papillatum]